MEPPAFNLPIVGRPDDETSRKVKKMTEVLQRHMQRKHPEQFALGMMHVIAFSDWLTMSAFEFEDETLTPRQEATRAAIFALVRQNTFTDANLLHVISTLGLDPDEEKRVFDFAAALRNSMLEIGPQQPEQPGPRLVTL